MEIKLPIYGTLDFERSRDYDLSTGIHSESKTAWSAVKTIKGIEIGFNFDCRSSDNKMSIQEEEMWKYVESCLLNIDGQLDDLLLKSTAALNVLHQSIFKKKVEDLDAYFLSEEVEVQILNYRTGSYLSQPVCIGPAYKLGFSLEPLTDKMALLDPYCSYDAYFTESGALYGVYREPY